MSDRYGFANVRVQFLLVHKLVIGIRSLSGSCGLHVILEFFRDTVQEARPFGRGTEVRNVIGVWRGRICCCEKETGMRDRVNVQERGWRVQGENVG